MTLYEMSQQANELLELLTGTADTDELSEEELEQIIKDSMEAIGAEEKLSSYGKIIKSLEARSEAVKKEKMRLAAYQSYLENNIKRLKDGVINYMDATAQVKAETDLFRFSIRSTETIEIAENNEVPSEFFALEKKYDKAGMKKYMKDHPDYICKGVEIKTNRSVTIK